MVQTESEGEVSTILEKRCPIGKKTKGWEHLERTNYYSYQSVLLKSMVVLNSSEYFFLV